MASAAGFSLVLQTNPTKIFFALYVIFFCTIMFALEIGLHVSFLEFTIYIIEVFYDSNSSITTIIVLNFFVILDDREDTGNEFRFSLQYVWSCFVRPIRWFYELPYISCGTSHHGFLVCCLLISCVYHVPIAKVWSIHSPEGLFWSADGQYWKVTQVFDILMIE